MKRRMSTIGIAVVLLLASFALTAFTTGGEETSVNPDPNGAQAGLQQPLDQGGPFEFDGALPLNDLSFDDVTFSPNADKMVSQQDHKGGLTSFNSHYHPLDSLTRASDEENEVDQHDFANGSKLSSAKETIDGTLTYDPDQSGSPDWRDWYKIPVTDIIELANTVDGVRNVSVTLKSYTDSSDGYSGLYEYTYELNDGIPSITSEFGDFFDINLIYYDPWVGYVDMGSSVFRFDDQDDTDGFVWDGDNLLYPGDIWSSPFYTPVNSDGAEDPDGFANGHTEEGWYYVGISLNFYIRDQTWSRDAFTVKYSLEIDTTDQEDTDQGSNAFEDAQPYTGTYTKYLSSRFNQVDWYKMDGSDPSKIWNISFTMDRHVGFGFDNDPDFMDNWLWTFVVWRDPGEDEEWNTDDDDWVFDYLILAFFITGGRFVSNADQNLSFTYRSWALENEHREVYIGIVMEPVMIRIEGGEIMGYYFYSPYPSWNNYTLDVNVVEEIPNHPPTLSELEISSDWPGHETGGHFGSTFYFNVTYTDEDNDPPEELNMVFDPDSPDEVIYDMLQYEVDNGDTDYTDGKDYSYMVLGEDLNEYLVPPVIMVNSSDTISIESIRFQGFTGDSYYNNTLYVWDDEPVRVSAAHSGEITLNEDEEALLDLDGSQGVFRDPENRFLGFQVWNETAEEWKSEYDSDLLSLKVGYVIDGWKATITPKPHQFGEDTVTFKAFDEHSNITTDIDITVEAVNDPPMVKSLKINGETYDVDNSFPLNPRIDLRSIVEAVEDEEFVIGIITEDMDNDPVDIVYSIMERDTDDWKGDLEIDENTGEITLIPNNDDIKRNFDQIAVNIDDGGFDIITLTINFDLKNTNDNPNITLSPALKMVYERGTDDEIAITPTFNDPDPGDTVTVSVNMEAKLEGVDPIVNQLPFADLEKGIDWDFNENIGRLWMKLDDWKIWKSSSGFVGVVNITVVFQVTDGKLTDEKTIILRLESDEPRYPDDYLDPISAGEYSYSVYDEHPATPSKAEGLRVNFEVTGTVLSVFEDEMEPKWEYDGEIISSEDDFDHTFETYGPKNVYLYFVKDNMDTTDEKISMTFTLYEPPEEPPPQEDKNKSDKGGSPIIPIVIVVIIILIIVVLIALFIVMRKKQQPMEAGQEYYDETPRFGGRGHSQELGAQPHTRGLSPARESEHAEKLPPKRGVSSGMSCPNCGASVQKDWFLCPECKNPLD